MLHALPTDFPPNVLDEATTIAQEFNPEEIPEDRDDYTDEVIVTIDPFDARDFDDAISLSKTSKGTWKLGVHIADVSHFVQEDTVTFPAIYLLQKQAFIFLIASYRCFQS